MLNIKYLVLALFLRVVHLDNTCFYTQLFTIFEGETNVKNWVADPGYSFSLVWVNPQPSITSHSYALAGFKIINANKVLSYSASLQSVTQSGATFLYNPTASIAEIVSSKFTVILLKACGMPFHIGKINLPISRFNNIGRIMNAESFSSLPLEKQLIGGYNIARGLISSFQLSSFISFHLTIGSLVPSYTTFSLTINSANQHACVFTKIKVTYIILARQLTLLYQFVYFASFQSSLTPEFNPPITYFPNATSNCIIGLYSLTFNNLTSDFPFVNAEIVNDISGPTLYNFSTNVYFNSFAVCITRCLSTEFSNLTAGGGSGICSPCSNLISNCYQCTSTGSCLSCMGGYYLRTTATNTTCRKATCFQECFDCDITNSCSVCAQIKAVKGGCSVDPGCIEANSSLTYLDANCIACNTQDNLELFNGICKCKPGYQELNKLCVIRTIGCATAIRVNNKIQCYLCNQILNFKIYSINGKCFCKSGYILNSDTCIEHCGDGIRIRHKCDDGNIISGDGCSHTCQIQTNFDCYGDPKAPSTCIYFQRDIKLELISITKTLFKNQGIIKLKIIPDLGIYNKINSSTIIFTTNRTYSLTQMAMNRNEISIIVDYQENLEGSPATVILNLGQPHFIQQEAVISFNITSDNEKLIMSQNQLSLQFLLVILQWISWVILTLFGISVFAHKMIGLQLLQNIQIIYFVYLINENQTTPFDIFMYLTNLAYNFLFRDNQSSNLQSSKLNGKFSISNYHFSEMIVYGSIIVPILLFGILLLVKKGKQNSSKINQKNRQAEGNFGKILSIVYNRIVFPLSMGTFYLFFLILGTKDRRNEISSFFSQKALVLSGLFLPVVYFS